MVRCKWTLCLLIFATGLAGTAGQSQTKAANGSAPVNEDVYGGYSVVPNSFTLGVANGWNAGADIGYHHIAAALDFGQYFSSNSFGASSKTFTFLVGPRIWIPVRRSSRVMPFGDVLLGGAYASNSGFASTQLFSSNWEFAWAADGGIDYRVTPRVSIRAQGGYLYTRYTTADNQVQQFFPASHARISTGVVYRF
jgi:opacity protein-like surface antigen